MPLSSNTNIRNGNALRIDWNSIIPKEKLHYIMGNPPFVGYKFLTKEQKQDLLHLNKNMRSIDYVSGWYFKTLEYIQNSNTKCALVSTNSICQGDSIENLWKVLGQKYQFSFIFAHRTFKWQSEALDKAVVHCVILGYAYNNSNRKVIYDSGKIIEASNINYYLVDAPNLIVERIGKHICNLPKMTKGAQLIDGGHFVFENKEETEKFLLENPKAKPYVYKYFNAQDFINGNHQKYCLYLKHCPPNDIKNIKGIYERVNAVKKFRETSDADTTRALKERPTEYFQSQVPEGTSIIIPVVSSENRKYLPMQFMEKGSVFTNALFYVDNAPLYLFGLLNSFVHMAWVRSVCGRLEMRYRYSNSIVYNNFVVPELTELQKGQISKTAQAILDARALYPNSSLADHYDPVTMPSELLKAHKANDKAVMALYGFDADATEEEIVAKLMQMYADKVKELQKKSK